MNHIITETPKRPGDEIAITREFALERAAIRARKRGCRQQVRTYTVAGLPMWLIQDVR